MAQRSNTFDGGSAGTVITAGNSGGASGNAFDIIVTNTPATEPAFSSAQVANGLFSGVFSQSAAAADFCLARWSALGDMTEAFGSFCLYITGNPAGTVSVCHTQTTAGGQLGRLRLLSSGLIAIGDTSGTLVATSATAAVINGWTRYDWRWQASPNQFTLRISTSVTGSPVEEITGTMNSTTAYGRQEYGMSQALGSGSFTYYLDNLFAGYTDWITPYVTSGGMQRHGLAGVG